MFFEVPMYQEYVLISNQHVVDQNRKVIERKLTSKKDIPNYVEEKVIQIVDTKPKNNSTKKTQALKINVIKYSNSNINTLNDEQTKLIKSINYKDAKKINLKTYSNNNLVSIARLENVLKQLTPEQRKITIYTQESCEKSLKCNITEIKTNY